jgi:Rne/Rng family ribonuclease
MTKELYVSSTPHETKVALVEDDQVAEIYYERENEYTLAGSIYKGRVTRVLPGMQSAFVDIGLERDAFLYVSDFMEFAEEEDEDIGQVQLQPHLIDPNRPAPQPAPMDVEIGMEQFEEGEENGEEPGADLLEPGNAEVNPQEEGGPRRWKGRRRRRGRRGGRDRYESRESSCTEAPVQGVPSEELTEEAENEPEPEPVPPPVQAAPTPAPYEPILLPGESIARYQSRGVEANQTSESADEQRSESRPEREFRDRGGRDRYGRRGRLDRGDRRDRREEETYHLPQNYQPIVLPGESISKYRNIEPVTPLVETPVQEEALSGEKQESSVEPKGPEVFPAPTLDANMLEAVPEPAITEEPSPVPSFDSEVLDAEHFEPAEVKQSAKAEDVDATSEVSPEVSSKVEHRFESMNVASVFGGNAIEEPVVEPEDTERESTEKEKPATSAQPEQHQAGSYVIEGGNVEHEEIDEDEADLGTYEEEHDHYHPHEVEEEILDANGGSVISDTVRETDEEAVLEEEEYEFNGGDEFEESEMVAEETEGDEEEVEPENGHAELRAPAGTAGFQQRAERPGRSDRARFDRRGRRPGGRRGMRPRREHHPIPAISDLLKEGQEVLIQIAKEPIGKKGARITSHIALPGRFLVYMPTVNHIGVSRKINSDEERQRLKRIVASERENGHGGFIVRTAAASVPEEQLRADIRFLKHLWSEIRNRAENSKSPSLIYHDLNLVERVLRDQVTSDFSQIWVDSQEEYERVVRFASRFQPGILRRIKLYTKDVPLFEQFGIAEEINKALKSKVWLKSGGYIVINQTEALVAIDINTGKYVGKTTRLEDTIVKTNVDAIKEIVRQIRLRDLGGIIVIDFIDMDERKNRQKVMQALEEALKADRAPSKVLQFNDFGLVAITRKRVKQSLERTLGTPCPYCVATGFVKSPSTVCNEIYVEMRKIRKQVEKDDVVLRVNPEVAKQLKANNGKYIQEFEELVGRTVLVKSDPLLHQEQFDINF